MWLSVGYAAMASCYGCYVLATIDIAHPRLRGAAEATVAGLVALLLIFLGTTLQRLRRREPAFVFDGSGVTIYPQGHSEGPVLWRDVDEITPIHEWGTPFVQLVVSHPEKYLTHGNVLERFFNRLNYRWYGSPVHLTSVGTNIEFDDLLALVQQCHETNRLAPSS